MFAADRIDDFAYRSELDDLARHLPLEIIRVLRDPPGEDVRPWCLGRG